MRDLAPGFALITGASSGIGAAIARALPADRPLLLTGRDAGRLEAMKTELAHGVIPNFGQRIDFQRQCGGFQIIDAQQRDVILRVNSEYPPHPPQFFDTDKLDLQLISAGIAHAVFIGRDDAGCDDEAAAVPERDRGALPEGDDGDSRRIALPGNPGS